VGSGLKILYNDIATTTWLRALVEEGALPPGEVSPIPIQLLPSSYVQPFHRAHFFAGIGGWEEALSLAGFPLSIPVWTGSCPCQPFSSVGQTKGHLDERHLWPAFFNLISFCNPPIIFGEQVAGNPGIAWLAGVRADLETLGYAFGAASLCAAAVGAPHRRQRFYWTAVRLADPHLEGLEEFSGRSPEWLESGWELEEPGGHSPKTGVLLLRGRDGSIRRVQSSLPPLVDGVSGRVGRGDVKVLGGRWKRRERIEGYGNAIVPQLAARFIAATMKAIVG